MSIGKWLMFLKVRAKEGSANPVFLVQAIRNTRSAIVPSVIPEIEIWRVVAISFAGVRERRRLGPTRAACLRGRDTLRWRDATKTSVHMTCTRDVRERLSKRKLL